MQVGDVLAGVAHHKGFANGRSRGRGVLGLQVQEVERLARQAASSRDGHVVTALGDRKARTVEAHGVQGTLDLRRTGAACNQGGAVGLAQVGEA